MLVVGEAGNRPVAPITTTPCADGGRSTVLLEQAAEWSIDGVQQLFHHAS